jgi:hypothetical protein
MSPESNPKLAKQPSSDEMGKTSYEISFNSMRIPLEIPITFSSDCRLGVYDLAEQRLDCYACNRASYNEIISTFEEFLQGEQAKHDQSIAKLLETQEERRLKAKKEDKQLSKHKVDYNFSPPVSREHAPLQVLHNEQKKEKAKKVKYFQYMHFVVPLYKFPGNAWATIFIPMFMLSLLSIFIFLQTSTSIEEKLGSIATFVLGFIALIPNIKAELPQSQKISLSEIIVYLESMNCMLGLAEQVFGGPAKKKSTIWSSPIFIFSLILHFACFAVSMTLLCLHYFVWEPLYNLKDECPVSSPETDYLGWCNPYCD